MTCSKSLKPSGPPFPPGAITGMDQIMFMNDIAQCLVLSKAQSGWGQGGRQLLLSLIRTEQGHASRSQGSQAPKQRDSLQAHFAGLALRLTQWSSKLGEQDDKKASRPGQPQGCRLHFRGLGSLPKQPQFPSVIPALSCLAPASPTGAGRILPAPCVPPPGWRLSPRRSSW